VKRASYEGEAAESSDLSFGYDVGRNRGARQVLDDPASGKRMVDLVVRYQYWRRCIGHPDRRRA
jgi:hypothetical protein